MKFNSKYAPLKFIEELDQKSHLVLLYDSPEYGDLVKYNFIEKGLKKGEHSIILTHEDPEIIKDEMESQDINVQKYLKENLLHIYRIENISEHPEGLVKGFNELLKTLTKDSNPPYRFMGTTIPDITTREGIEAELAIERLFHSNFSKFDCSFLCVYNVPEIEKKLHSKWLSELIQNHHHVIYATDPKNSVVFDSDLLDPE
ncbi:MAG: MEDS domain-containing protein [Nitrosopumilus sp.]|nr:MEDS domain-containing protein [Nitrosopumilus sp.]